MSNVGAPTHETDPVAAAAAGPAEDKGKGKVRQEDAMDEDDDDDEEDEEEGDEEPEEDEEMEDEDEFDEIDPASILPQGRRTRGVKVDYNSAEALEKAGLQKGEAEAEDEEEFVAKDGEATAD